MKTRNLTAGEAENLLACGMIKFIQYERTNFLNVYGFHEGVHFSVFKDDIRMGTKPSDHDDTRGFRVVDKPTWEKTKFPEGFN